MRLSALVCALAALLVSCGRKPAVERVAVLPFENLSGDASLDWMGRGLAEVVGTGITGERRIYWVESLTRQQAVAAGAGRIVYGQFFPAGGRLRVNAWEEDLSSGKTAASATVAGAGVPDTGAALARQLAGAVRPFGTRDGAALKAYCEALRAADPAGLLLGIGKALAADPGFGRAYAVGYRAAIAAGDLAAAARMMDSGTHHRERFTDLDRARFDLEAALARGNAAGRRRAQERVAGVYPADPAPYRGLAELATGLHQYPEAAKYLRTASALHPSDAALLNNLGYAEAWTGDLPAAAAALEKVRQLHPADANALDSLGDVHLHLGKCAEAVRFYRQAWATAPAFLEGGTLFKAAMAALMAGDRQAADAAFQDYLRAGGAAGPAAEFRRAEWLWLTGRRREALARMEALALSVEPARVQVAFWKLSMGEPDDGQLVRDPAWTLLLRRDFAGALPLLRERYGRWAPGAGPAVPVLLAWAYAETGRTGDAAGLLAGNPVPRPDGPGVSTSLWFPRLFFVRGLVLEKQGKRGDARRYYRLFLDFSGPDGCIWGEEQRARAAQ